jgi:ribosomal protein S27E
MTRYLGDGVVSDGFYLWKWGERVGIDPKGLEVTPGPPREAWWTWTAMPDGKYRNMADKMTLNPESGAWLRYLHLYCCTSEDTVTVDGVEEGTAYRQFSCQQCGRILIVTQTGGKIMIHRDNLNAPDQPPSLWPRPARDYPKGEQSP